MWSGTPKYVAMAFVVVPFGLFVSRHARPMLLGQLGLDLESQVHISRNGSSTRIEVTRSAALDQCRSQYAINSSSGRNLRIKKGTIVYLVQGPGPISQRWLEMSTWANVSLIFLAWNESRTASPAVRRRLASGRKFKMYYCPNTTWTTGRNELRNAVVHLESEQGWDFEYLVYSDDDVRLLRVPADPTCNSSKDGGCGGGGKGFRWLNTVLMRDRPMQASVSYPVGTRITPPQKPNTGTQCVQRCHADHLVMAYHRTAAAFLLPYEATLDSETWWSSAYLQNLYVSALVPQFCNYYYELTVDMNFQVHGEYPKGGGGLDLARSLGGQRLVGAGVAGFWEGMSGDHVLSRLWSQLNPNSQWRPCKRAVAGVDYSKVLADKVQYFLKCHWQ